MVWVLIYLSELRVCGVVWMTSVGANLIFAESTCILAHTAVFSEAVGCVSDFSRTGHVASLGGKSGV